MSDLTDPAEHRVDSFTWRLVALVSLSVVIAAIALGTQWWTRRANLTSNPFVYPDQDPGYIPIDSVAFEAMTKLVEKGGKYYGPLKAVIEVIGVENPDLVAAADSDTPDSAEVIAFEVDGRAFAFCVDSMLDIERHVVNVNLGKRHVAVAYCDLSDCTRVVTRQKDTPDSGDTIDRSNPLGIGGLDVNDELVLLYEGERYAHRSDALPMDDVTFERMSLGEWKTRHPETLIYEAKESS